MTISKETTGTIKIYMPIETKIALTSTAKSLGISLSELILQAATDRYLVNKSPVPILDLIVGIEARLTNLESGRSQKVGSPQENGPTPKTDRKSRTGAQTFLKDGTPAITETGTITTIFDLVLRFGGDRTVKARLCQVGGRDGKLFRGDLASAERVAAMTSKLDPQGESWFPVAENRISWIQISAEDFCRKLFLESNPQKMPSQDGL